MKNSKTLLFSLMMLLLATLVLFVSCNQEAAEPRTATEEDSALVTDVVEDVTEPEEGATEVDYDKAFSPYVNEAINDVFGGEGITLDGVTFKLTTTDEYKVYDGGIAGLANIPLTITLKDVDVTTEDATVKKVNGTIYYTGDPNTVTGSVTAGDGSYTGDKLVEFFNEVFGEDILPKCAMKFFTDGVEVEGDKLSVYAKGSIEYEENKDESGVNTYKTIKSISLDEFSLKTKEDVQLKKDGNKYSLDLSGTAKFSFKPDEENQDEQNLTAIAISEASFKLGIKNESGEHTIEITTSFNYPGEKIGVTGLIKLPFSFVVSEAKIDGEQVTNESMMTLLLQALAKVFSK